MHFEAFLRRGHFWRKIPPICLGLKMSINVDKFSLCSRFQKKLSMFCLLCLKNNDNFTCLVFLIPQSLKKLQMRQHISARSSQIRIFFRGKMVDSNFFFIYVGRPDPDQYCGKGISKSKQASIVKTGLKCHFFKRYLDRKTTLNPGTSKSGVLNYFVQYTTWIRKM